MGLFGRIFGSGRPDPARATGWSQERSVDADTQAIERYRYLLRTAPPEAIEQAHAEAFAQLTPEQRRRVLDELARDLPAAERDTVLRAGETPASLARAATRAEMREPGTMERTFGRMGAMPGGMMAGTFLGTMAGAVLGTALAQSVFGGFAADAAGPQDAAGDTGYADSGDAGFDFGDGGFDI